MQAWLKSNPHGVNHIYINTEKPGVTYMSYINDWWSISRPHFHVLDANSRLVHMWHPYQMGKDGSLLVKAAKDLLPTTVHVVPLPPAPPPPPPALHSLCASEGHKCKCNGVVKFGLAPRWSSYIEVTNFTESVSGTFEGSILCSGDLFGDPYRGVTKQCMCRTNYTADTLNHHRAPRHMPTRAPTPKATARQVISSGHPYVSKCSSMAAVNAACPLGHPVPNTCNAACAQV